MAKKLEGNGMWSSSRMMLPEHVEGLLEQNRGLKNFARPTLDEQEIELVNEAIQRSIYGKCLITLNVYDTFRYRYLEGVVTRIDHKLQQIKFTIHNPFEQGDPEQEWIPLLNIMKAEVKDIEVWDGGDVDW